MTAHAGDTTPPTSPPPRAPSRVSIVAQESLQGHYAGFASRFAAFVVDVALITGLFMLALAAGMALFGVQVVRDDGGDVNGRRAIVRTLALPLSFLLLGLGFLGILLGNQRRALHDVIAGTAVVYCWDARAARLRFLSRG